MKRLLLAFRPKANPIIVKELRSRMRGPRAFVTLTGVLVFMSLISYGLYRLVIITSTWNYAPLSPQIGQTLFIALAVLEMLMVCAITPAVTASAISSEHEKLTYEMLLTTPLQPTRILRGKLIAALSYIFLLIFAAVPMASLVFIYGGVSPRDMLKGLFVIFCTAIMLGVLGIFLSTWLKRSGRATVFSYLIVLMLFLLPTLLYGVVGIVRQAEPPRWLLVASPMSALFSAISPSSTLGNSAISMLGGLGMLLSGNVGVFTSVDYIPRPIYHYSLPLYGMITLVLYMLSTRLIRPARRWRLRRRDVIAAVISIALLAGLSGLAFAVTTDRYENISIFAAPTPFPQAFPEAAIQEKVVVAIESDSLPIPESETVHAYLAIIRAIADQSVLPEDNPLFLSRQLYMDPASPDAPQGGSYALPESTVTGIGDAAADLSYEIEWLDDFFAFPPEESGNQAGVLILFGMLDPIKVDLLQVNVSVYFLDQPQIDIQITLSDSSGAWEVIDLETILAPSSAELVETFGENLPLSFDEIATIYSAAILQAYTTDSPMPGVDIPEMYIVKTTVLSNNPVEIPELARAGIEAAFESLPFAIVWVESRTDVPIDSATGKVAGSGGLIELGNIDPREDGSIEVMINLHYSDAAQVLATYILQNIPDGGWQIVEFGGNG